MNGRDLWVGLGGSFASDADLRSGRPVAKVVSGCGSRVGEVRLTGDGPQVVVDGYRLTRPHTASVLADQIFLDFEELLRRGEENEPLAERLLDLVKHLAPENEPKVLPLEVPGVRGSLEQMLRAVERARRDGASRGHLSTEVTNMTSVCKKCRQTLYLADAVVAWNDAGRDARVVVAKAPQRFAKAQGFNFPDGAFERRVSTYDAVRALYY